MKGQFGKDDFYARSDGAIRLNGKAEAFVSGWFGDIAYQQNYAEADKDKSGRISGEEWREIKTYYVESTYDATSTTETSLKTYVAFGDNIDQVGDSYRTIEEGLNYILETDRNFDGNLERIGEVYSAIELMRKVDKAISQAEKNTLTSQASNIFELGYTEPNKPMSDKEWKKKLEKLKEMQEELDEQFAKQAKRAKEQLEQMNEKGDGAEIEGAKEIDLSTKQPKAESMLETQLRDSLEFGNPELSPVVDEIRSKIASNDAQLFELQA